MADHELDPRELLRLTLLVEGGLAIVAGLAGWASGVLPWQSLRLESWDAFRGVAASLPMLVLFLVCVRWPIGPLRELERFADEVLRLMFRRCTTFDLALIAAMAGIGEELFFRGFLQPYLAELTNAWIALALVSILFGLFHPISTVYVILAAALGAYLGWLMLATDNLLPPIIAHAVYDFVGLVYLVNTPANETPPRQTTDDI